MELIRQINLELIDNSQITWHRNFPWWFHLSPVRKKIMCLKKIGAVLTGSRALQGYQWKGKKVINRKSNDWDWILTRPQLIQFFKDQKIYDLDLGQDFYRLNNSLATFYDSYSDDPDNDTPILNGRLDLIVVDNLADFETYEGWNVQRFSTIWQHKEELNRNSRGSNKHWNDINYLKLNFLI